ncbi:hypothetical protein VTI74DRAFT_6192 [Chaetomium olivicolor]
MEDDFQIFTSLRYDPALLKVPTSALNGLALAGWNRENSSPFYMLDYHRDRMLRAATYWGWGDAIDILSGDAGLKRLGDFITYAIGDNRQSPLKVRVSITKNGQLSVTAGPVPETPLANLFPERLPPPGDTVYSVNGSGGNSPSTSPEYEVLVDSSKTTWSDHSHFKTTKRVAYDAARQRAQISLPDKKEVLIVDKADGAIMEGSTTTPYLWREGRWVTPAVRKEYHAGQGSGGQNGTSRRWALERGIAIEDTILADSLVDGEECWLSNGVKGFFFGRIKLK